MIRNEIERRNAEKDLDYLRTELEKRADAGRDDDTHEVAEALRIKASDIEADIREYDDLRAGRVPFIEAESLDGLGELLVKARISKDWSQADLAKALEMEPQQVQRYERNDWQKASLWRLQEAAEALELDLTIRVWLDKHASGSPAQGLDDVQAPTMRVSFLDAHGQSFPPRNPLEEPTKYGMMLGLPKIPSPLQGILQSGSYRTLRRVEGLPAFGSTSWSLGAGAVGSAGRRKKELLNRKGA